MVVDADWRIERCGYRDKSNRLRCRVCGSIAIAIPIPIPNSNSNPTVVCPRCFPNIWKQIGAYRGLRPLRCGRCCDRCCGRRTSLRLRRSPTGWNCREITGSNAEISEHNLRCGILILIYQSSNQFCFRPRRDPTQPDCYRSVLNSYARCDRVRQSFCRVKNGSSFAFDTLYERIAKLIQ